MDKSKYEKYEWAILVTIMLGILAIISVLLNVPSNASVRYYIGTALPYVTLAIGAWVLAYLDKLKQR